MVRALRFLLAAVFGCAVVWGIERVVPEPWTLPAWLGFALAVGVYSNVFITKRPWWAVWNERFDRNPR